jgi:hypothetical protein
MKFFIVRSPAFYAFEKNGGSTKSQLFTVKSRRSSLGKGNMIEEAFAAIKAEVATAFVDHNIEYNAVLYDFTVYTEPDQKRWLAYRYTIIPNDLGIKPDDLRTELVVRDGNLMSEALKYLDQENVNE